MEGFLFPKSPTGKASLIPAPPWHYSGEMITVEYRTDPARGAELLPDGAALAPEDPAARARLPPPRVSRARGCDVVRLLV